MRLIFFFVAPLNETNFVYSLYKDSPIATFSILMLILFISPVYRIRKTGSLIHKVRLMNWVRRLRQRDLSQSRLENEIVEGVDEGSFWYQLKTYCYTRQSDQLLISQRDILLMHAALVYSVHPNHKTITIYRKLQNGYFVNPKKYFYQTISTWETTNAHQGMWFI